MNDLDQPTEMQKLLDQSSNALNAPQVKLKGRGRPKKVDSSAPLVSSPISNAVAPQTQPRSNQPSPMRPMIDATFRLSGAYLNQATNSNVWELSKEELEVLVQASDDVAKDFTPSIEDKWARLAVLAFTLSTIYGVKYFDMKKEHESKTKVVDNGEKKEIT